MRSLVLAVAAAVAQRGSETVDLTGTVTKTTMSVDVPFGRYACDGSVIEEYTSTEDANVHRITLQGAMVGDVITIGGIASGVVQPSAACTEDSSTLTPYCTDRDYSCEGEDPGDMTKEDDAVGCNAGRGAAPGALALLVLALRRRRR